MSHESGWTLSAFEDGRVVWENAEEDDVEPRHMEAVGREHLTAMFEALASGDIAAIEANPWVPGY